jgi:hypothetical protein
MNLNKYVKAIYQTNRLTHISFNNFSQKAGAKKSGELFSDSNKLKLVKIYEYSNAGVYFFNFSLKLNHFSVPI